MITLESFIDYCDNYQIANEENSFAEIAALSITMAAMLGIVAGGEILGKSLKRAVKKITNPKAYEEEKRKKIQEEKDRIEKERKDNEKFDKLMSNMNLIRDDAHFKENQKKVVKKIQKDTLTFLKAFVNTPEFKNKYKIYFPIIKLTELDECIITITDVQDGIDDDYVDKWFIKHNIDPSDYTDEEWNKNPYTHNEWYCTLLTVGEDYIHENFSQALTIFNIEVDTGDGDEGMIHMDYRPKQTKNKKGFFKKK